jgi:DNA-directed RNA polymerase subunit H (RpoH/RPB5)
MQSGYINSIYKSRCILLDLLKKRNYNTSNYDGFSLNEIHIMYKHLELDILVENENKKVCVKYVLGNIRDTHIYDFIDDLFNTENILNKSDELIIVTKEQPNETILNVLRDIYNEEEIFINIICIKNLQFNILEHQLVPYHKVLDDKEKDELFNKYNIQDGSQLPTIDRFDPVSLVIGLRPKEVCEITRKSKTSITSKYYRICSQ